MKNERIGLIFAITGTLIIFLGVFVFFSESEFILFHETALLGTLIFLSGIFLLGIWKEFLKPDLGKLLIFAIFSLFFLLYIFTLSWGIGGNVSDIRGACCATLNETYISYCNDIFHVTNLTEICKKYSLDAIERNNYESFAYFILFLNFIPLYIFSCFLVWIFGKLRKRR